MESKICEANTHPPTGGFAWSRHVGMGISLKNYLLMGLSQKVK